MYKGLQSLKELKPHKSKEKVTLGERESKVTVRSVSLVGNKYVKTSEILDTIEKIAKTKAFATPDEEIEKDKERGISQTK